MSVEDGLLESGDFEEEGFKRLDENRRRRGFELLDWGWLATYSLLDLGGLLPTPAALSINGRKNRCLLLKFF